uniref:Uncharacterized protein n=1 Tax=Oryza nivara TaxID=4536 RepID=A0A0E0FM03_ORYNI
MESDRNVFLRFGVPCHLHRKEPFPRGANLKVTGPSSLSLLSFGVRLLIVFIVVGCPTPSDVFYAINRMRV